MGQHELVVLFKEEAALALGETAVEVGALEFVIEAGVLPGQGDHLGPFEVAEPLAVLGLENHAPSPILEPFEPKGRPAAGVDQDGRLGQSLRKLKQVQHHFD
jgi:hypothetical protein